MSNLHFANPEWIHAIWLVIVFIVLLVWLDGRGRAALDRLISITMQTRLAVRPSRGRRWMAIGLLGAAVICFIIALMRPQGAATYRAMPRVGAQIMICLDVSKSMLAEDTAPNRLDRAKAELVDLLTYLDSDQVGLIAFAGKATVLCPLTPDFGFFRLILDAAGPTSVGRGGTRLEEPIRKAMDGFRTESNVSRAILLVTDGEDHDSYPIKAAEEAAERGIKIITIGFGDEAGSQIPITDPKTGVRQLIKDADGQPVLSKLDGETLRKMAMTTEGAYVPAGTGALDLESIYKAHIAPLTRGRMKESGHAVRSEYFQWAIFAGLLFLLASTAVAAGTGAESTTADKRPASKTVRAAAAAVVAIWMTGAGGIPGFNLSVAHAADANASPHAQMAPDKADKTASGTKTGAAGKTSETEKEKEEPRTIYNSALAKMDSDTSESERLFMDARKEAGTDGELRFRASYNLGWVEVKHAEKTLKDKPQEALKHLQTAANWFRDAVRLRPDHKDSRHNLEVVLRRIMELADSLRKKDSRDLKTQLDQLIEAQRGILAHSGELVQNVAAKNDPNAADQFRSEFRQLAVNQRTVLADSQTLATTARDELTVLEKKKDEEKQPADKVRASQLNNVLYYMNRVTQRMTQARSQMRQRQGERAFRRSSAALDELKRARDQLRNPAETIGVLYSDALQLAGFTSLLAAGRHGSPIANQSAPETPAWLSRDYLIESQTTVTERANELVKQFEAMTSNQVKAPENAPQLDQDPQQVQAQQFLDQATEALPFLESAASDFDAAGKSLSADDLDPANQQQFKAIVALQDARERFLDLRRVIEVAYAMETQIQNILNPPPPPEAKEQEAAAGKTAGKVTDSPDNQEKPPAADQPKAAGEKSTTADTKEPDSPAKNQIVPAETETPKKDDASPAKSPEPVAPVGLPSEVFPMAIDLQEKNIERGQRLTKLLDQEFKKLPPEPPPADQTSPQAGQSTPQQDPKAAAERQRLQLARQLLETTRTEMAAARDALGKIRTAGGRLAKDSQQPDTKTDDTTAPVKDTAESTSPDVDVARQHVATAVQQLQELRRLFFSLVEHLRETVQRQAQLNDETQQVAALGDKEHSDTTIGPLTARQQQLQAIADSIAKALQEQSKQQPPTGQQPKMDAQQQQMMQEGMKQLAKASKLVRNGSDEMTYAVNHLNEGTPGLKPARENQDTALKNLAEALALLQPPQPQQQKQDDQKKDQQKKPSQNNDPSQLLQAVRDREAQRRKDRQGMTQREPVEKDW